MPGTRRIPSFLLVLMLAAVAGWFPGGSILPGTPPAGAGSGLGRGLQPADHPDFDHLAHIAALGGDEGCLICHPDRRLPKTRKTSTSCSTCHGETPPGTIALRGGHRDAGVPSRLSRPVEGQTQPVGLGRPATLQAPLAGPEGNIW
jgi:hypothetical protein